MQNPLHPINNSQQKSQNINKYINPNKFNILKNSNNQKNKTNALNIFFLSEH